MFKGVKNQLADRGDLLFKFRRLWPWLVLSLSLALVAGIGWLLIRYVERQEDQAMRIQAVHVASRIDQRVGAVAGLIRATASACTFVPRIDADFFSSSVGAIPLNPGYRGRAQGRRDGHEGGS